MKRYRLGTLFQILRVIGLAAIGWFAAAGIGHACDASAGAAWEDAGPGTRILARTLGPNCAEAIAVFVIRDGDGRLLYQDIFAAKGVFLLADLDTPDQMKSALAEWVTPGRVLTRTGELPEWPEGADGPTPQEFPFYPNSPDDAPSYREMRAANLPMFCYVQGMESARCIAVRDGVINDLGVQSFPG